MTISRIGCVLAHAAVGLAIVTSWSQGLNPLAVGIALAVGVPTAYFLMRNR